MTFTFTDLSLDRGAAWARAARSLVRPRCRWRRQRRAAPQRRPLLPLFGGIALLAAIAVGGVPAVAADGRHDPVIHLVGSNLGLGAELRLVCPQDRGGELPSLRDRRSGRPLPIADPQLMAVAKRTCRAELAAAAESAPVAITNQRGVPIYVGYSGGGSIDWGQSPGCTPVATGLEIAANTTCDVAVTPTNSGSRFCAGLNTVPNCLTAQNLRVTLVEPTFDTSAQCRWTGQPGTCVSYDISLIPVGCTDALWQANQCATAGGASYNLPVMLNCEGQPFQRTFTCQGPVIAGHANPQSYPSRCGNPNAACDGNSPGCVNAYFYPMSTYHSRYQPVGVCSGGRTLHIVFPAGP